MIFYKTYSFVGKVERKGGWGVAVRECVCHRENGEGEREREGEREGERERERERGRERER